MSTPYEQYVSNIKMTRRIRKNVFATRKHIEVSENPSGVHKVHCEICFSTSICLRMYIFLYVLK